MAGDMREWYVPRRTAEMDDDSVTNGVDYMNLPI